MYIFSINIRKLLLLIVGILILVYIPSKLAIWVDSLYPIFSNSDREDPLLIWLGGVLLILITVIILTLGYVILRWLQDVPLTPPTENNED